MPDRTQNRHTDVDSALVAEIAEALQQLGVRPGGVLLVHSSLSSLGYVPGGPETVIQALLKALGPGGTLLMPALSYLYVTPKRPLFDVRTTPSNVGAIPEAFRLRRGTYRSIHPTHSVCALGPLTKHLLEHHKEDDTPCGPHSPFSLLPEVQGQILMLGCGLRPNTSMHGIEERVVPPYLFAPPTTYVITDYHGVTYEKTYTPHSFQGWEQRYDRVAALLSPPALRTGHVLQATCHLLEAEALWERALSALQRNPLAFVEPLQSAT
ncbi:MAG TPA: AAC(3) family N-acetyltransferase [Chloroflexi bacterium]|nr:AAC(3) family N-acetyltransferase [Chloroflexota bacterium]